MDQGELYVGKFISSYMKNTRTNQQLSKNKSYSIRIKEVPKKDAQSKKQQKLHLVSSGPLLDKNQQSVLCRVKKGQEVIYKKYICHGIICHIFDEMWVYLLNAGYVKLKAKALPEQDQIDECFGVIEIQVYLNNSAITDDYELKIWEPKKPKSKQTQLEKKELQKKNQITQQIAENLRFAKISLLLMLDFMNIVIEQPALIKSDKQVSIFFTQYQKIFEMERGYHQSRELLQQLKSYPRYVIEDEKYFKTYITNKNFHNRLFSKEQIQLMTLTENHKQYHSGNKKFTPIYKLIHPILHLQFQRIAITFYNSVIKFLNNNISQVNKTKREEFVEDFMKSVFLSKYISIEKYHESETINRKMEYFIRIRRMLEQLVNTQQKVPCLDDVSQELYVPSDNSVMDLLLVDQVIQVDNTTDHNKQVLQEMYYQNIKGSAKDKQNIEQNETVDENDLNEVFTQKKEKQMEFKEKPATMKTELKQHQKEALYWMLGREKQLEKKQHQQQQQALSPFWAQIRLLSGERFYVNMFTGKFTKDFVPMKEVLGGILADEMGLGKTLMALALILETQKKGQQTLIIVPKSVLLQWQKEIQTHSKPNAVKVLVYYKSMQRKEPIKNYDIILTTYTILGQQYQAWQKCNGNSKKEEEKKQQEEMDQFMIVLDELAEDDSDSEDVDDEVSDTDEKQVVQNKEESDSDDVSSIESSEEQESSSDFKVLEEKKQQSKKGSKTRPNAQNLFNYSFYRVILDEAHNIKNRQTVQAKGAAALEAQFRWCLTGTPIQNKHDDLFGLVQFLRVETFSDYFWWNTYINKEQNEDEQYKILQQILKPLILRRTKNAYQFEGMQKIQEKICWVDLKEKEKILYDKFHEGCKLFFKNYYEENTKQKSYIHIFEILNKLRMSCDHPALALKDINLTANPIDFLVKKIEGFFNQKAKEGTQSDEYKKTLIESIKNGEITECQICTNENIEIFCLSPCGHIYCKACFTSQVTQRGNCPSCRKRLTINDLFEARVEGNPEIFEQVSTLKIEMSSKLAAILEQAKDLIKKKQKILVFTQWINMIEFIEKMFSDNSIKTLKITGSMTADKREKIINTFRDSNDAMILLLSLRATATGLNLTMANNVFIVDPWWNPAIEDQAIGRADRIGQKSQVKVFRFICKDTIEQQINVLHQKKKIQFTKVLNADQKKEKDFEDLKFLLLN